VKRERGVKVRTVQGGKRQEGRREVKESGKQAESEEEEGGCAGCASCGERSRAAAGPVDAVGAHA
jgi:biotin synthase-like enzyme